MSRQPLIEEDLTGAVIRSFYAVYNELGYGYLEIVYVRALVDELAARGYRVEREATFVVRYKGKPVGKHRLDLVIDGKLIVEVKSSERVPQASLRQLFSYLKASRLSVGLLLHFGPDPKFYRQIFRHPEPGSAQETDPF